MSKSNAKTQNKTSANGRKSGKSKDLLTAIAPFAIFAAALFLETCLILSESAGKIGIFIRGALFGMFGYAAHALCICAIVIAFFFNELNKKELLRFKLIITSALLCSLCALNSLIAQNGMKNAAFSVKQFFESGKAGESGGVIGGFFGILLSKLFTPIAATVICVLVTLVLISFALGLEKLGLWRTFAKQIKAASKKSAPEEKPKKITPPSVSARKIDTMITGESRIAPSVPEISAFTNEYLPESYGEGEPENSENQDFDEINGSIFTAVDFSAPEQDTFAPVDLMEEFGLKAEKPAKPDIYDENPAPAKKTGGIGYSPFATFKSKEEFFASPSTAPASAPAPTQAPAPASAYSPFADPFRSLEQKKAASAPIENKEVWDAIKQNAPQITEQAPIKEPEPIFENPVYTPPAAAAPEPTYKPQAPDYDMQIPNPVYEAPAPKPIYEPQVPAYEPQAPVYEPQIPAYEPKVPAYEAPAPKPIYEPQAPAYEPQIPAYEPKVPVYETPAPEQKKPTFAPQIINSAFDDEIEAPEQQEQTAPQRTEREDAPDPRIKSPYSIYNKLRYPRYHKPSTDLLDPIDTSSGISEQEIYETQSKLHDVFENFNVNASVTGYSVGPSITRYEITPGPGVKAKQITGLGDDIALALQAENRKGDIRIVTVQGKSVMGVEVPNSKTKKVSLRALIENKDFQNAKSKITVCVGLTVSGKPVYMNIDDMPHVLVAGQTKSGKSVAINCMIISLIYRASPDEVQLILIDPKRVELSIYNDIPHMAMPVIDDPKRAAAALKWAVAEMERRYELLNKARVRNRDEYYATRDQNPDFEYMPQIVIIIDELADLMLQVREHVEGLINRLAAMARACGMHIVIGTQRPSVDVVTGLIKANIPSHIAFKVSSHTDSRVILGNVGAEKLLGRGDMLYHPTGSNQIRAQGAFVDTPEIKRILNYIIEKNGKAEYDPEVMYALQTETDKLNKVEKKSMMSEDDFSVDGYDPDFDLLCQATELVLNLGKATTNVIQRHLKIGFNRAANIVEKLEEIGFVSAPQGSKPRDVLVDWKTYEEWKNLNAK